TSSSSLVEKEAQLAAARTELETAMADLSAKEGQLKEAEALAEQDLAELMAAKQTANSSMTASANELYESIYDTELNDSDKLNEKIQHLASNADLTAPTPVKRYEEVGNIDTYMKNISTYLKEAEKLLNEANKKNGPGAAKEGQLTTDLKNVKDAIAITKSKYEMLAAVKATYQNASQKADAALKAAQKISSLKSAVNSAGNYVNECQARVTALTNEINNSTAGQNKQKADISVAKINAEANLKQAEEELAQLLKDISGELNLDNQNDLISRQREKVAKKQKEIEKLRENAVGAVIKAPVAGIVTAVNVMAGDKTEPAKELAVMQPDGKGFSMSFSVTAEQAKKVNVGELAEIQNSWFYSDIEATLTGIRPDPENPGEKKLLVFDVKGDVQAGQSISLSIGQKSMDYDLLVPNSAVREDNQGKFILLVESKNSPLGNRYIAKRVDVEVLGADDLKTAINAPINSYEYVITTATQPVEAGKQVRLAETD
ncbi:MAG: HlyD family efflux transporter periplasmic adaptor subunit, partial [Lachnospiraceae bacterium]|nr:HlyD family efflux transporter periplasmic adaptor subunit [Lachnospiraceae bacterium]